MHCWSFSRRPAKQDIAWERKALSPTSDIGSIPVQATGRIFAKKRGKGDEAIRHGLSPLSGVTEHPELPCRVSALSRYFTTTATKPKPLSLFKPLARRFAGGFIQ